MLGDMNLKRSVIWNFEFFYVVFDFFLEFYLMFNYFVFGCLLEYQFERSMVMDGL